MFSWLRCSFRIPYKKSRPSNFRLHHLWALEKNMKKKCVTCEVLLSGFLVTRRSRWWREGLDFPLQLMLDMEKKHLCRIVKVFWDQVVTTTFLYTQNTSHAVSLRYIRCLCWEKNMDLSILWSKTASLLPNCSHKKSTVHESANIPGSHGYHNKISWKFSRPF